MKLWPLRAIKAVVPAPLQDYARWLSLRLRYPGVEILQRAIVDKRCSFGRPSVVHGGAEVICSNIGRFTYISRGASVRHASIGSFCSIAPGAIIGGYVHPTKDWASTSPVFFSPIAQAGESFVSKSQFEEIPSTTVGNDVWVGYRAIILPGRKVGDGAIIGAGATITKDVPDYAIVAGVPGRVMRLRFSSEEITWLKQARWWDRDESWLREHASAFASIANLRQASSK